MARKNRSPVDRRGGSDRRKSYHVGYFMNGGLERRSGRERRSGQERRKDLSGSGDSDAAPDFKRTKLRKSPR